ncbi:tRNA (adenosine(37)-N6)-threonylcarbamoyltransferase complex dimerization subunit type 1 TsaB [Heliorestis acidaminivorans]|uniref:tRNA (Adenosine(37)-N6)-threonylcarbamoyltransferase complex dimerization subunit type 1 TsaB n=1 Tax=Heliorestis acidaminivorans TaxID=553427 RepID=A0A6I0EXB5_9FIRM|nr:tRNA (adenosine(37)-N6)-threonylcarbamoyltransferase complex dimerization subunit type 1 TsaB [Heliorestis acidaminivorans]KAB2951844.1 tRNA (adenosine(37)-N6)-threonylcarbamoyltransferase complex dimerization subunit type 1 TsaB [Heliorestis acidaminivorans]
MYLLGLDCSTSVTALAIATEERVLAETFLHTEGTHSERLMPAIEATLAISKLRLADLQGIAVAIGPGSFTGLRIGLATAKGIAHPLSLPVVAIPTLDALARNAMHTTTLVCPILDARKSEVYTSLYQASTEGMERLSPYEALSPEALVHKITAKQQELELELNVLFLGDAVPVYRDYLQAKMGTKALFAPPELAYPRGSQVARLGLERLKQGEEDSLHELAPLYIRPSEAEVNYAKQKTAQTVKV